MGRSASTTPFVARDDEVRVMLAALDRAAAGDPGLVLVGGDAGVGKSRLIDRVAELGEESGATVVTTHCVDLGEVGLPYLPFAEALARLRRPGGPVDRVVEERPALGRLLPSGAAAGPTTEDHANRLQLFDGLAEVLGACGQPGAPLVLVVEDLHWADSSSRDVLRFLVARMRAEHLLLVGSYRTDDLHRRHPLRAVLAELARHPRVERLELAPFDRDELRAFRTALTGTPPAEHELRRLAERSEGNAYYAQELIEAGAGTGDLPGSLADVLRARVEDLDPTVQALARAASVAGRRVSEPLLRAVTARAAPTDPQWFDVALREAVARNVLGGEEGQIAFRHALLAEAVYGDLLPGEQVALHGAYCDVLSARPELGSPAQLAHHALHCNDPTTALRASRDAARQARGVLAPAEELRHLETVLRLWDAVPGAEDVAGEDRIAVTVAAASAAGRAGLSERGTALCRQAVQAADGDPGRQAPIRAQLARFLLAVDHDEEAFDEATRALADVPETPGDASRAWALAVHAFCALAVDRDEESRRSALAAVQEARRVDAPGAEADALATLAVLVVDDPEQAAALLAQAQERARAAGDLETELRCHFNLTANQYYAGLLDEAADLVRTGLDRARSSGLLWNVHGVQLLLFDELVRYARGNLSPAPASGDAPPPAAAAALAAVQLYAAVARGDADAAARGLALRPEWERDGQVALISGGCTIDALTWAGRLDEAVGLATTLIEHMGRVWDDVFLGGIWIAALGLAALADGAAADRLAGTDPGPRLRLGADLLARAVTTAERGRPRGGRLGPEGRAWLARAHAEHARLAGAADPTSWEVATGEFAYGYRYEEARSRRRWAEALLEAGDRTAAGAQLRQAWSQARAMGATPLVDALETLARRGRLDLPGVRAASTELLTSRETEVLELVAAGLSNRQIGDRLFISAKTVSVHVSNLLAKLGASGRAEAVTLAHRRGLLGTSGGSTSGSGAGAGSGDAPPGRQPARR
ncbi:helix-turn-helix transcriptional regulator [Cellulomonas aerilata]|uniref:LuxR family transcriptional regulator n=1 Tax=Cellulomonas aerilata TaxID=515326 RepID=A0A512D9J8_9CELL|nr:AAA family ATPase [Cellulomonas aerilata]GEO33156.1 LuxR family transcriptional regulator [Cellulomonas aerilata]